MARLARTIPIVEEIMTVAGVPGMSIGIISPGEIAETYHLGYRDVRKRLRPNDQTRYSINSLTKGIVSLLVGMEVFDSHGRINWEDPIQSWLPEFRGSTAEIGTHSNIVDLLSHRTGVIGLDDLWMGADNVVYLNRSEACRTFASFRIDQPFRTGFEYNNWGVEIVGQVLEAVSGQSISSLLRDRIFVPLRMKRTSTLWDDTDDNESKSYGILQDRSLVEVRRPQIGNGTIMEVAGGVKSTIEDMLILYDTFLRELDLQFSMGVDSTGLSPLRCCRMVTTSHARLPGMHLREQGYGMGWVRAQIPGQVGQVSANVAIGDEPIVGKGSPSRLILYNHGCMPGATSAVYLVPELGIGILILQNSMPVIDTSDFVAQMLLETLLEVPQPNDFLQLTKDFYSIASHHLDDLRTELERHQIPGTKPRYSSLYEGRYSNILNNFNITVLKSEDDHLFIQFQGLNSQTYRLEHYHRDVFSWLMPYDEIIRRDRGIPFYPAEYYLVEFQSSRGNGDLDQLVWAVDPDGRRTVFTKIPHTASYWTSWGLYRLLCSFWK